MLRGLRAYLNRERTPKLVVMILLTLTFGAGFITSKALLGADVTKMAIRYPVAVLAAWLTFMLLVRLWAELERRRFQSPDDILELTKTVGEETEANPWENSGEAALRVLEESDATGDPEGCLLLILIPVFTFLVIGIIGSLFVLVCSCGRLRHCLPRCFWMPQSWLYWHAR